MTFAVCISCDACNRQGLGWRWSPIWRDMVIVALKCVVDKSTFLFATINLTIMWPHFQNHLNLHILRILAGKPFQIFRSTCFSCQLDTLPICIIPSNNTYNLIVVYPVSALILWKKHLPQGWLYVHCQAYLLRQKFVFSWFFYCPKHFGSVIRIQRCVWIWRTYHWFEVSGRRVGPYSLQFQMHS